MPDAGFFHESRAIRKAFHFLISIFTSKQRKFERTNKLHFFFTFFMLQCNIVFFNVPKNDKFPQIENSFSRNMTFFTLKKFVSSVLKEKLGPWPKRKRDKLTNPNRIQFCSQSPDNQTRKLWIVSSNYLIASLAFIDLLSGVNQIKNIIS